MRDSLRRQLGSGFDWCESASLTRSLVPDGLLDQGGHDVPEVVGGARQAPPVPLVTRLLLAVVTLNHLPDSEQGQQGQTHIITFLILSRDKHTTSPS